MNTQSDPVQAAILGAEPRDLKIGAMKNTKDTPITLWNPYFDNLPNHIRHSAEMVKGGVASLAKDLKGAFAGEPGVVVVSTGPTVEDVGVLKRIKRLVLEKGYKLCALKEAGPWLNDMHGLPIDYAVGMDPGGERQIKRTPIVKGCTYFMASTCHPEFLDYLATGADKLVIFHSATGAKEDRILPGIAVPLDDKGYDAIVVQNKYELQTTNGHPVCPVICMAATELGLYAEYFDGYMDCMQGGFTVTNRAVSLMKYLGFPEVHVAGADFGWRDPDKIDHYASFVEVTAEQGVKGIMNDGGKIDGKVWYTRPDQLPSAVTLAKQAKAGEVKLIGKTLARALSDKPIEYLDSVVALPT